MTHTRLAISAILVAIVASSLAQQNPRGLYVGARRSKAPDVFTPLDPSEIRLTGGMLGDRFDVNENNRLLKLDEQVLLDPFEHRDKDHQAWSGEHVGKFLHAATLVWRNTADSRLKAKIDDVAARLIATQEPDGYLGTYRQAQKWKDWDVWVHKYDLLGLLTYWQYTKSSQALEACRKIGDLLCRTFGPSKLDINAAGEHVGLAPDSVLEPMVLLYRATGESRYLDFARYIVRNYDADSGPKILSTLEQTGSVRKIGDAKAYEMMSNFNGLLELYRAGGERRLLDDMNRAYGDIVDRRLNVLGSGSTYEVWNDDGDYPNTQNKDIGETCVSVTWEQMCLEMLRLKGDAGIADQMERTIYNALLGAQKPDGASWDYYTSLDGLKPYSSDLTCCISSGARGIALLTSIAAMKTRGGGLVVNLYNPATIQTTLPSGKVQIRIEGDYPYSGDVRILVRPSGDRQRFPLLLRIPQWAEGTTLEVDGKPAPVSKRMSAGYAVLDRAWSRSSEVRIHFPLKPRFIPGIGSNRGKVALGYGPLVFAVDAAMNPGLAHLDGLTLGSRTIETGQGEDGFFLVADCVSAAGAKRVKFVPFAVAGRDGKSRYAVWVKDLAGNANSH